MAAQPAGDMHQTAMKSGQNGVQNASKQTDFKPMSTRRNTREERNRRSRQTRARMLAQPIVGPQKETSEAREKRKIGFRNKRAVIKVIRNLWPFLGGLYLMQLLFAIIAFAGIALDLTASSVTFGLVSGLETSQQLILFGLYGAAFFGWASLLIVVVALKINFVRVFDHSGLVTFSLCFCFSALPAINVIAWQFVFLAHVFIKRPKGDTGK